jgi:hypothetical protein
MGAMIAVEREKWRVRLPSRCEEVVGGMMVVFAVLNVVRAEAWEKRREEDSVAVLIWGAGVLLTVYVRNNHQRDRERIPTTNRGELS